MNFNSTAKYIQKKEVKMDYDLPLLLSPLQNDREWKSVEVNGSYIANPGVYNLKANGLFLYLYSSTQNSNILFIPNYIPIPDSNNKRPVVYLQCISIQKIKHTFIFSDLNQVMNFVNYIYKSNIATENFIKNVYINDYLVGDQISGIIPPTNQKLSELMVISQIQARTIVFQAHIVNKDGIVPGITYSFSKNSFVSPIYEIPKSLKKEKDILTRSFTFYSIDNPKDVSIFIVKNESEMVRMVMAFYVSIIYSSNQRMKSSSRLSNLSSGSEQNFNLGYANSNSNFDEDTNERKTVKRRETHLNKILADPYSFVEILDKTILSDPVKPVSIKHIHQIEPISYTKDADYKSYLIQPPTEQTIENLKIELPSDYNKNLDSSLNIMNQDQNFFDDNYSLFNFESLSHREKNSTFSLIDKIGINNDEPMKDIELIEEILNLGIKEDQQIKKTGAWNVFCDISEEKSIDISNNELDNLVHLINQLKNSEQTDKIRKCQTPLQDFIRIGIKEKILHLWILQTISYKEIVQKYFNPESTLLDCGQINYFAFTIYNFIK